MERTYVISMGDPAGVGPEILLKAHARGRIPGRYYVAGNEPTLRFAMEKLGIESKLHLMESPADMRQGCLNVLECGGIADASQLETGKVSKISGDTAWRCIRRATECALEGQANAIVTLPVNKEAVQLTHAGFTGHTEMIAEMCGESDFTMMLASEKLNVTHVSTHVSMLEAVRAVKKERVLRVIALTHEALKPKCGTPRIAVAGLNAHAGEHGLFGREEIEEIKPAISSAHEMGMDATGPYPPDTVFHRAAKGEFDAVVCMYHDQGHIPLKLLDFDGGVNVTLGLKVIRTSVDHGTAFDIAYAGVARPESFLLACQTALDMMG